MPIVVWGMSFCRWRSVGRPVPWPGTWSSRPWTMSSPTARTRWVVTWSSTVAGRVRTWTGWWTGSRRRPGWHVLRTAIADLAAALGFTAGALGKIAIDVQTLVRTEVGEVAEPAVAGRGSSSAMPHKRNPVLATLVRSAALQVPVIAAGLTQCLVSEDERSAGAWHAEWQLLRECLRLTGGAAHTAVELTEE